MKNSGVIDKAMFSVRLGKLDNVDNSQSEEDHGKIQFGFYDTGIVEASKQNPDAEDQGIKWFTAGRGSTKWKTSMNHAKVNGT